ncbi:MAG: hypothetical protein JSV31_01500 [Desulfobacterales bacterium]|nr:MAG: hypothetical protein JSV31_01500 [Desulfobacterales bacterium]
MKSRFLKFFFSILFIFTAASICFATVEWQIIQTLNIDASPLDMAVSPDGRTIYVLTEDGNIYIYSADGTLKDKIHIGSQVDHIKIGPKGERLFVSSRHNKTLKVITLDFIYDITTSGAPSKGAKDAAVIIAVFSDFQ